MLDYGDVVARIEKPNTSETDRSNARAYFFAADANVNRLVRAVDWLSLVDLRQGRATV